MSTNTSVVEDETFLNTILGYPVLFDKNDRNYRSNNVKNNCWEKVAVELEITAVRAKGQFKALREKFRRELKFENGRSGDGAKQTPRWLLFGLCQMMFDTASNRGRTSNVSTNGGSNHQLDSDQISSELSELPSDESFAIIPSTSNITIGDTDRDRSFGRKRKAAKEMPTREEPDNDNDKPEAVDQVLKQISLGINQFNKRNESRADGKPAITTFLAFLGVQLRAMSDDDADDFIDFTTAELLAYKRNLKN